jgi:hypothetical protein
MLIYFFFNVHIGCAKKITFSLRVLRMNDHSYFSETHINYIQYT